VQKNALAVIYGQQASSYSAVVRKWLVAYGEIFRQEVTPAMVQLWESLLSDILASSLDWACYEVARSGKFFPTPGEIRSRIEKATDLATAIQGETEWQNLLDYIRKYLFPDFGLTSQAPPLPEPVLFAARAAGGLRYLERCSETELQWAKKRFIEAYQRFLDSGSLKQLPSTENARRILREAASMSNHDARPANDLSSGAPDSKRSRPVMETPNEVCSQDRNRKAAETDYE